MKRLLALLLVSLSAFAAEQGDIAYRIEAGSGALQSGRISELPVTLAPQAGDKLLLETAAGGLTQLDIGALSVAGGEIELRATDTHIQWRRADGEWADLIALSELEGAQGVQGEPGPSAPSTDGGNQLEVGGDGLLFYSGPEWGGIGGTLTDQIDLLPRLAPDSAGCLPGQVPSICSVSGGWICTDPADGVTDLSVSYAPAVVSVLSSTGDDAAIGAAVAGISAGVMSASQAAALENALQAEADPLYLLSPAAGISSADISEWSAAFAWGDHAGLYLSDAPLTGGPWGRQDGEWVEAVGPAGPAGADGADGAPGADGADLIVTDLGSVANAIVDLTLPTDVYLAHLTGSGILSIELPETGARTVRLDVTSDTGAHFWLLSSVVSPSWAYGIADDMTPPAGVGVVRTYWIQATPTRLDLSAITYWPES